MRKSTFGLMVVLLALGIMGARCEGSANPAVSTSPTTKPGEAPPPTVAPQPTNTPAPTSTPEPRDPPYINLNLGREPRSADPKWAIDPSSRQVTELLFMGLTDFDQKTGDPIPELAEEWTVSTDGLKWTFHLRDDVYWVNYSPASGTAEKMRPVNAQDVVDSVLRVLEPDEEYHYGYRLHVIKGAQNFHYQWDPVGAETVGVRALDDHTVEFELENPAGYFPAIVGLGVVRPVPREAIEEHGDNWTEPGNIWTNGPYMLDTWDHENKMVMVRNPEYPDAANVQIDTINWLMVTEYSTALTMYENGELDVSYVPHEEKERVKEDPVLSTELYAVSHPCTYHYGFNITKEPVDNVHVRRALSYAMDRQALVNTLGDGQPASTFACPGIFGSPAEDPNFAGIEFDPEMAKKELELAGYPGGAGLPKMTLMFSTSETDQKIAQTIQANWKEHLGIEVELANQEWQEYYNTLDEDAPQIFHLGWCADYPDENNWVLEVFHSTKGAGTNMWSNSEFDQLVEQAAFESDPAKRRDLYYRAEGILCVDEAGIIPIYYYSSIDLTKPYVDRTPPVMDIDHVDEWAIKQP